MYELSIKTHFSAAHFLRGYEGKCENMHGHNWDVEVSVKSDVLNGIGIVIDFKEMRKALNDVLDGLDHKVINDEKYFIENNPSCENIAKYIFDTFKDMLIEYKNIQVSKVKVWETQDACVVYGEE